MLKAFLPRYTFTKVPDFLGTSFSNRLPDSWVTENKITAPSPCSIHGLIRVSNGNPIYKAGSFSHFKITQL